MLKTLPWLPLLAGLLYTLHSCPLCSAQTLPSYRFDLLARDGASPANLQPGWSIVSRQPAIDDDGTVAASIADFSSQLSALWVGRPESSASIALQPSVTTSGEITIAGPLVVSDSPTGQGLYLRTREGTFLRHAAFGGPLDLPGSAPRRPRLDSQARLGVTTRSSLASGFANIWLMESLSSQGALQQTPLLSPDAAITQLHPGTFTDVVNLSIAPAGSSMFNGVVTLSTGARRALRVVRTASNTTFITPLLTSGQATGFDLLSTFSDASAQGHIALTARSIGQWRVLRIEPAGSITTIAQCDGLTSPRSLPITTSYESVQPAVNAAGLVTFITQPSTQHPAALMLGNGNSLAVVARDGQTLQTSQGPVTIGAGASGQRISFRAPPAINAQGQIAFVTSLSDFSVALLLATPQPSACPADLGSQGGAEGGDLTLDNNDFIVFINQFFQNAPLADLGSEGGERASDGLFDNNDFIVFIQFFFEGC